MASTAYPGSRAKRRPAARNRRPGARSTPTRIKWDRIGRIALVLVLFAVAYSYLNPAINLFNTYRSTTASKAEFHQLLQENKRLHRSIQSSDNPAVVAAAAREQGMVAAGETPFVLRGLSR
jgi:cell division protein FtsB